MKSMLEVHGSASPRVAGVCGAASGRISVRSLAGRIALGTIPERSARSLDESSACTEVCVNGFRHSVQADLSRHTGCFPCAKFEIII